MDPDLLDRLGDDLRAAGYDTGGVLAALGEPAHRALARGEKVAALRATSDDGPLATLIRLFLLGRVVTERAVAAALPRTGVGGAVMLGSIESVGSGGLRAALDIRPHAADQDEFLVVSDLDSDVRPGPVRPDHVLGIGTASLSLARATVRDPVGSVLDIGVGCGIQALHCAGHAGRVTGTDTNPRALTLAAATARLSGQKWELLSGSLFGPIGDRRFDLIVSNPPFVVSAGEQRYSYRDSGVAGDGLVRRLVAGLPGHLNPGGTAQLLANWIVHEGTDWRERVGSWVYATGLDGWVVQRELADPVEYVALWLADAGENADEKLAAEWLEYFERERVSGLGMGLITLRDNGSRVPTVTLDELPAAGDEVTGPEAAAFLARQQWLSTATDADLLASRLALADSVLLEQRSLPGPDGWLPVYRLLRRPGGPGAVLQLDEWTQGLLAGCRGDLPLQVLLELFAAGHGFDLDRLTEAVLPAIRHAVGRGMLHPTADSPAPS